MSAVTPAASMWSNVGVCQQDGVNALHGLADADGQRHERVGTLGRRAAHRRTRARGIEHGVDEQGAAADLDPQGGVAQEGETHRGGGYRARRHTL